MGGVQLLIFFAYLRKLVMAHLYKVRHYYVNFLMAHLHKVRHYYVQEWVKPWSNIVMAHFSPGVPLLFRLLMAHYV